MMKKSIADRRKARRKQQLRWWTFSRACAKQKKLKTCLGEEELMELSLGQETRKDDWKNHFDCYVCGI